MRSLQTVRNATAQADTGQTDTVQPPPWAKYVTIYVDLSAVAGTTPLFDFDIDVPQPSPGSTAGDEELTTTQLSAADLYTVHIGPGITGIADDTTAPIHKINMPLPWALNLVVTLDRTTGNETYTYSIICDWSG